MFNLLELIDLHGPTESCLSLQCHGCDAEGFESEYPEWPCRTAILLFSKEEIEETLYWFKVWRKWILANQYRKRMATGWSFSDDVREFYSKRILSQLLQPIPIFTKIN